MLEELLLKYRKSLRPYADTFRLAASYLLIIMVLTVSFSGVLYHISAREIGRQVPPAKFYRTIPDADYDVFRSFFDEHLETSKHELIMRLLALNIVVLLSGGFLSYVLARRTLEPIEAALDSQSRFASDASHELRTPLAVMQAENEVALRNSKLSLDKARLLIASNLEEVTRLQALSDGLLQLARDDAMNTPASTVNISSVTSEAINYCIKLAQSKDITIVDKVPRLYVAADEQSLTQALTILIDNAIKYSPPSTTITVKGGTRQNKGYLSVTDEGIGIPAKDRPYIFERFYRADTSRTSQTVSGTGLGLAIAANIMERLGGSIEVTSKVGHGSTFTLHIPPAKSPEE